VLIRIETETFRRRWHIAAFFDSAREGIDRANRANRAAVMARLLSDQTNADP
jgi:hypothetical protein